MNRIKRLLIGGVAIASLLTAGLTLGGGASATPPAPTVLVPSTNTTLGTASCTTQWKLSGIHAGDCVLDASAPGATSAAFYLSGGTYTTPKLISGAGISYFGWLGFWNTSQTPDGTYSVVAHYTDAAGTSVSPAISVTVANAGPSGQPLPTRPPAGYQQIFADDFSGSTLGRAWSRYGPGSNYGCRNNVCETTWDPSHDVVSNGMLQLRTYQDPAKAGPNNPWVEGGVALFPSTRVNYGTWLVRSRVTDAIGVTQVELLWPDTKTWPPEVDFNESTGGNSSGATEWYSGPNGNTQIQPGHGPGVDLTQWHTWGVTVTPSTITYTVDGNVWATMPNDGVNVPMHLGLQQMLWPSSDPWETATGPVPPVSEVDMQVDWVAVYSPLP